MALAVSRSGAWCMSLNCIPFTCQMASQIAGPHQLTKASLAVGVSDHVIGLIGESPLHRRPLRRSRPHRGLLRLFGGCRDALAATWVLGLWALAWLEAWQGRCSFLGPVSHRPVAAGTSAWQGWSLELEFKLEPNTLGPKH